MRFSIVIPVFNNSRVLSRALQSIINQQYIDFEAIVVDDGSTEDIDSVIKVFSDSRIHLIRQDNSGVASARNTGVGLARGDYVCFLDSDDEYLPNHLEVIREIVDSDSSVDVIITSHRTVMVDGSQYESSSALGDSISDGDWFRTNHGLELLVNPKKDIVHTNSMCIKRSFLASDDLFTLGCSRGEDLDLWYRSIARGVSAYSRTTTTIRYREDSTLTKDNSHCFNEPYRASLGRIAQCESYDDVTRRSASVILANKEISDVYHLAMFGEKQEAFSLLRSIPCINECRMRKMAAFCCLVLPRGILRLLKERRGGAFYRV